MGSYSDIRKSARVTTVKDENGAFVVVRVEEVYIRNKNMSYYEDKIQKEMFSNVDKNT